MNNISKENLPGAKGFYDFGLIEYGLTEKSSLIHRTKRFILSNINPLLYRSRKINFYPLN
jgi:hypothetical protein